MTEIDVKACRMCRHNTRGAIVEFDECGVVCVECRDARKAGGGCGPDAKWWQPKETPIIARIFRRLFGNGVGK